jgi:hypothetical protein
VIEAMKNHPSSVAVQSAACGALRSVSSIMLRQVEASPRSDAVQHLVEALCRTRKIALQPSYRSIADQLISAVLLRADGSTSAGFPKLAG